MPHRAASPALSENEVDISNALFNGDASSDLDEDWGVSKPKPKPVSADDLNVLDGAGQDDDGDDDDEAFIAATQAAANRKASNLKGRTVKKGGGFQAMGLNATLLKAIARKGFSVPTPIQRKTIPAILDDRDVVGMARTGSGKTAAFVIPMIEKLKSHSSKFGLRGLILSPSRELALQTLKVVKELSRGTDLKVVLLVGGDSLEEQFGLMAGNPDIVIATPGRFLHLKVEMRLDLSSVKYVVFDEADRLFEMGFAAQLTEILSGLPPTRQTLLFSATLPKSLVEFAKAGLQEPTLIRLDTESKISPDLQNAFFSVKSADKEGALLYILHDVIKIPPGPTEAAQKEQEEASSKKNSKKRKRESEKAINTTEPVTKYSTIIFAATKHHVDYLVGLLREAGFSVSYAYGSLDQTARKIQVQRFRSGITNILVVTDVAARGIDIPILANVINYDFPSQPKIFVHRVGRTARAGQKGWSYSLVREADIPYLLDLQLFLGRRLVLGRETEQVNFAEDIVVGSFPRDNLATHTEWVAKVLSEQYDLESQRAVAMRGEKLYMRTRNAASLESAKRAKEIVASSSWMGLHALFNDEASQMEVEREKMLARLGGYRPSETIFEIDNRWAGKKSVTDETTEVIKRVRSTLEEKKKKKASQSEKHDKTAKVDANGEASAAFSDGDEDGDSDIGGNVADNMSMASESDLEVTFSAYNQESKDKKRKLSSGDSLPSFQNPDYYMSYTPTNTSLVEDRAYGVRSGTSSNFAQESREAALELTADEQAGGIGQPNRPALRWDKRHKKYVARRNDEDGSKGGTPLIRGESGAKIPASFRSGRFDAWRKSKRLNRIPRVGESEDPSLTADLNAAISGRKFRHNKQQAPKQPDKLRGDYEKKKKKLEAAKQRQEAAGMGGVAGRPVKSELKSNEAIRKERKLKEKRREKNGRPPRKGKGR